MHTHKISEFVTYISYVELTAKRMEDLHNIFISLLSRCSRLCFLVIKYNGPEMI